MLRPLRQQIINNIWQDHRKYFPEIRLIEQSFTSKKIFSYVLDHFAIIDLPSEHSGIPTLKKIFETLGYEARGQGYLPEKQNDFMWLTEIDAAKLPAKEVLPQVVIADFRLDELPKPVRDIVHKYVSQSKPFDLPHFNHCLQGASEHVAATKQANDLLLKYLSGRDWPLPTLSEFEIVREFNELLAWVIIFGRRPNHFTLSVHLLSDFNNLADFHYFIRHGVGLPLNEDGGEIKGSAGVGIEQGSTLGNLETVKLRDSEIKIPTGFVEFVWRHPQPGLKHPRLWGDYFPDFVANHADYVVESLYT